MALASSALGVRDSSIELQDVEHKPDRLIWCSHSGLTSTDPLGFIPEKGGSQSQITSLLDNRLLWVYAVGIALLQVLCIATTGDGFFGHLTGGVVESFHLPTGTKMTWHALSGTVMWTLAMVQICFRRLRIGPLAWVHRSSGKLMLILWFLVCGPTAAYLSLFVGVGKANAQLIMTAFTVAGLETTLFASYYFWRGLVVARHRINGAASLTLHGKSMRTGTIFTMVILYQRPLQFIVITIREVCLIAVAALPSPWGFLPASWVYLRQLGFSVATVAFDHNVILSVTTIFPSAMLCLFVDGPGGQSCRWLNGLLMDLSEVEEQELFGGKPSLHETLAWRLRVPFYLILRGVVTRGFSEDPALSGT